jgi:pSer/pThr/pTyr-binding forkhead associated (FHA) protein
MSTTAMTTATPHRTSTSLLVAELHLFDTHASLLNGHTIGSDGNKIASEIPRTIQLYHEPSKIILGRGIKSDILISAQKDGKFIISRQHAAISVYLAPTTTEDSTGGGGGKRGVSILIEDLDSLNGVYVNDVRVKREMLKQDDIVQFGGMSDVPIGGVLQYSDVSIRYRLKILPQYYSTGTVAGLVKRERESNAGDREREKAAAPGSEGERARVRIKQDSDTGIMPPVLPPPPLTSSSTAPRSAMKQPKPQPGVETDNMMMKSPAPGTATSLPVKGGHGNALLVSPSQDRSKGGVSASVKSESKTPATSENTALGEYITSIHIS